MCSIIQKNNGVACFCVINLSTYNMYFWLNSLTFTYLLCADNKEWNSFFEEYLEQWIERLSNWVFDNHSHPVHVVSYEDLENDTVREVEKILDFLHFQYSHEEVTERLREDFANFKRSHGKVEFQYFSPEQKDKLRETLMTAVKAASDAGKTDLFHFSEYLESLDSIR